MRVDDTIKLLLGTFVRPSEETGTGQARIEAVYGYLVRHDRGLVLLDTGLGEGDPDTEAWLTAQAGDYTMEHLVDHPGATYELLDAEAEIWPGVHVIPTPGHVEPLPAAPAWMDRLLAFDPKRVLFAHDAAVWEPS